MLKLTDQPGGMEVIAATFANRGVSLACSLGNDGALDPEGPRHGDRDVFRAPGEKGNHPPRARAAVARALAGGVSDELARPAQDGGFPGSRGGGPNLLRLPRGLRLEVIGRDETA